MRMMSDLLDHLCQLARLNLVESEREEFSRKFASLLDFIERIKALSAESDSPTLLHSKDCQETRPDIPITYKHQDKLSGPYSAGRITGLEESEQ